MATKKLIKQHSTHPVPDHTLLEMYEKNEFECDGCKTDGIGMMYQCDSCDFNLHQHCATCPNILSSFMHPQHELKLVPRENKQACNLCGDSIRGIFYKCDPCKFYVHPLCTQLPQYVRDHKLHHPDHPPLELKPPPLSSPTCCKVCKEACSSWHYRCATCRVDIHPECVVPPNDAYESPDVDPYTSVSKGYPPSDPYASARSSYPPAGYGAYAGPSAPPSYPPAGYGGYAGSATPPPYQPPSPSHAYGPYAYGVNQYYYPMYNQYYYPYHYGNLPLAHGGGGVSNGWKPKKKMFGLVGRLAIGVIGTAIGLPSLF